MIIEPSWKQGFPELVTTKETQAIESGQALTFELSKERHCIGFHASSANHRTPCMRDRIIPEGKEAQCDDCRVKDVSFAAKTGFGDSKQATELLIKDHAVYLALFSEDIIKVGVSVWERREIRTKEQGATACLFVGKGNGTVARNLERRIHTNLGFTEWVRANIKLAALGQSVDAPEAELILRAAFDRIKTRLGETSLIEPEFMYHLPSYGLSEETASLPICQVLRIKSGARFGGVVAGILGKLLLLEYREKLYAVDMNLLSGYVLERPLQGQFSEDIVGFETKSIEVDRQQSLLGLL